MKSKINNFLLLCTFYSGISFSQLKTFYTPNEFGQFYNNPSVCFSQKGIDNSFEAGLSNITNVGRIKGINTSYAYALFTVKSNRRISSNSFGINIYNLSEGPYLYKRKIHFVYIRHQQLNKEWMFSGGFQLGVYNSGVKANEVVGGVSSTIFDGNASFSVHNKSILFGVGLNQFTNGSIQPFSEIITLPPYLSFYGNYKIELTNNTKVFLDLTQKYLINTNIDVLNGNAFGFGSRMLLTNFLFGINYYNKGLNFIMGINEWKFGESYIDFNISYYNSLDKLASINPNKLELSLIYKKK